MPSGRSSGITWRSAQSRSSANALRRLATSASAGRTGTAGRPGALYHLLRNPAHAGKVTHGGVLHEGVHTAIIDPATWQRVQDLLDGQGGGPIAGRRAEAARWLDGRLFDRLCRPMRSTCATRSIASGSVRHSKRYWYYVSTPGGPEDKKIAGPAAGRPACARLSYCDSSTALGSPML